MTTHYLDEAARLCDRLVIMDNGKILVEGAPADLVKQQPGFLIQFIVFRQLAERSLAPADRPGDVFERRRGGCEIIVQVIVFREEFADGALALRQSRADVAQVRRDLAKIAVDGIFLQQLAQRPLAVVELRRDLPDLLHRDFQVLKDRPFFHGFLDILDRAGCLVDKVHRRQPSNDLILGNERLAFAALGNVQVATPEHRRRKNLDLVIGVQLRRLLEAHADVHAVRLDLEPPDFADAHAPYKNIVPLAQPLYIGEDHIEPVRVREDVLGAQHDREESEGQQNHEHKGAHGHFHGCFLQPTSFHRNLTSPIRRVS